MPGVIDVLLPLLCLIMVVSIGLMHAPQYAVAWFSVPSPWESVPSDFDAMSPIESQCLPCTANTSNPCLDRNSPAWSDSDYTDKFTHIACNTDADCRAKGLCKSYCSYHVPINVPTGYPSGTSRSVTGIAYCVNVTDENDVCGPTADMAGVYPNVCFNSNPAYVESSVDPYTYHQTTMADQLSLANYIGDYFNNNGLMDGWDIMYWILPLLMLKISEQYEGIYLNLFLNFGYSIGFVAASVNSIRIIVGVWVLTSLGGKLITPPSSADPAYKSPVYGAAFAVVIGTWLMAVVQIVCFLIYALTIGSKKSSLVQSAAQSIPTRHQAAAAAAPTDGDSEMKGV